MLSTILNEGGRLLNSSIMNWSDVASRWWKITTGKRTIPSPGTIATGTVTSSDAVVSDYTNWCWHAESSESWLLNFNPTQESNNQSHTTPEIRYPPTPPTSVQTNTQTLIYHPQAAEISHIYHYLPKVKTKSGGKAFPCAEKVLPYFNLVYFPATRADPLYRQQIIELETFNPLIWQVPSTFNSSNASNPGNKGEHGKKGG